ncbi:MAG: GerMN domain-containing protein [Butyricicoccus sp.]|nr:GerMN domain-containing protein [Butyricicoccus sp.]
MKKRLLALLCVASLLAGVMACGKEDDSAVSEPPASDPVVSEPVQSAPVSTPVEPETRPAVVYLPDDNAEELIATEIEMPVSPETDPAAELSELVAALTAQNALPADSAVVSVELGEPVRLDMNAAFGAGMMSTGTTGEMLYLGALVNTVLDHADAESVLLTVEGEPLETGHNIYDEPIRRIEP